MQQKPKRILYKFHMPIFKNLILVNFLCAVGYTKSILKKIQHQMQVVVLGPVVQSIVSLTSSLRVISLTVLADSIYNILIFFAEKM